MYDVEWVPVCISSFWIKFLLFSPYGLQMTVGYYLLFLFFSAWFFSLTLLLSLVLLFVGFCMLWFHFGFGINAKRVAGIKLNWLYRWIMWNERKKKLFDDELDNLANCELKTLTLRPFVSTWVNYVIVCAWAWVAETIWLKHSGNSLNLCDNFTESLSYCYVRQIFLYEFVFFFFCHRERHFHKMTISISKHT